MVAVLTCEAGGDRNLATPDQRVPLVNRAQGQPLLDAPGPERRRGAGDDEALPPLRVVRQLEDHGHRVLPHLFSEQGRRQWRPRAGMESAAEQGGGGGGGSGEREHGWRHGREGQIGRAHV